MNEENIMELFSKDKGKKKNSFKGHVFYKNLKKVFFFFESFKLFFLFTIHRHLLQTLHLLLHLLNCPLYLHYI